MVKITTSTINNISNAPRVLKKRLYKMIEELEQTERNLENSLRQTDNNKVIDAAIKRYEERREKIIIDLIKSTFPFYTGSGTEL